MRIGAELLRVAAVSAAEFLLIRVTFTDKVRATALKAANSVARLASTSSAPMSSSSSSATSTSTPSVRVYVVDVGSLARLLVLGGEPALGLPADSSNLLEEEFIRRYLQQLVLDWLRVG